MSNKVPLAMGGYGPTLLTVSWVEFAICTALIIARVYTAWVVTRRVKLDLYLTLLTYLTASLSEAFLTMSIVYGLGQHIRILSPEQIVLAIRWSWANQILAIFAIAFGKLAIVAFLHQLHTTQARGRMIFLWTLAGSNLVINTITVGFILAQCSPVNKLWDDSIAGTCDGRLRNQHLAYFQGSWSAFVDVVLAVYPIAYFWTVQIKSTVKAGLCVLMGFGILAGICAVLKTTKLVVISETSDVTYYISQLVVWNETEMWIVLIVGCIPPIRPLFIKLFRAVTSTVYGSSNQNNYTQYHQSSRSTELRNFTAKRTTRKTVDEDGSEENILIMRTTNINVTYDSSHPSDKAPNIFREAEVTTPKESL